MVSIIETDTVTEYIRWIGNYHTVLLHFPIALLIMTGIAELLFSYTKKVLYANAARFMCLSAAILVVPTVLLGLAMNYSAEYPGKLVNYMWWHQTLGIVTLILVIATAYIREYMPSRPTLYYNFLVLSILLVLITSYFGGSVTFEPTLLLPPPLT